jgi:hypothetical protein
MGTENVDIASLGTDNRMLTDFFLTVTSKPLMKLVPIHYTSMIAEYQPESMVKE